MYCVIGSRQSRARRVLWMLEEADQPYTLIPARPHSPEAYAHNATGKVPILIADGTALTDSTAIVTFLADRHSVLTFPPGSLERARQDGLTQFVLDEIEGPVWTAARHSFVLPPQHRNPALKPIMRREFIQGASALAIKLGQDPFLMGDTMTIPDIIASQCLDWAQAAKFPLQSPSLQAYQQRLQARPAYRRALAAGS